MFVKKLRTIRSTFESVWNIFNEKNVLLQNVHLAVDWGSFENPTEKFPLKSEDFSVILGKR